MSEASLMTQQLDALLFEEQDQTANLANASALLMQSLSNINWAGFYLYQPANDELVLGPFQGKVACMHIKNGAGVCGSALQNKKVQRVANVHDFPGHIACDSDSNAEIVVPLYTASGQPIGVMDIDSTTLDRFSPADEEQLVEFANVLVQHIDSH
ncbi:GAF domain-containing protein [Paucilactobacillus wasatchensis]|uniref:Free methionine-(R)-sulfoxide reductase n=1 Tax=Paucilactobacillus wasatchensis TaxID=1335616 RepID=A0A0D1A8R6_9LACO|nr:GAF domain-containing protein [Paucilactobacillus wasatchensis]KIS04215.1 Free methionine-(R)-sulfoxide reductase [Paucilactobacillus wasatchensis]